MTRLLGMLLVIVAGLAGAVLVIALVGALFASDHFNREPEDVYAWLLTGGIAAVAAATSWRIGRRLRRVT